MREQLLLIAVAIRPKWRGILERRLSKPSRSSYIYIYYFWFVCLMSWIHSISLVTFLLFSQLIYIRPQKFLIIKIQPFAPLLKRILTLVLFFICNGWGWYHANVSLLQKAFVCINRLQCQNLSLMTLYIFYVRFKKLETRSRCIKP